MNLYNRILFGFSSLLATGVFVMGAFATVVLAMDSPAWASERQVQVTYDFTPKLTAGVGDLYIPLPQKDLAYQKVLSQKISGNATFAKELRVATDGKPENDIHLLHLRWENVVDPQASVTQTLNLSDRQKTVGKKSANQHFLRPTQHVQTDGIVLETANKILKSLKDPNSNPDQKAQAIYDWIIDNTFRDPSVRGCGLGDAKGLLQSGNLQGKCADLNSLFVALARAAGLPAREIWGLRVAPSAWNSILGKEGDVSKSQHCRAEYYSETKKAWVPVDPADIRKLVLDGKLELQDPVTKTMRKTLFGKSEGNWVAYNYGRDFQLPGTNFKVNYFMYPLLVSGNNKPDGMDPSEVQYTITSQVKN